MIDKKNKFFSIINSKHSSSLLPLASKISQSKTISIFVTLFFISSFFSLIYFQNFNIINIYANAASSLGESIQKSQQNLQSAINKQVQQSLTNTVKSINNNKTSTNYNDVTNSKNIQNNFLITNILTKNLENHIQKAGAILNITSKLPQVREIPFANTLNQTLKTLHGIPQGADVEKRQIAKNIISSNSDLYEVAFFMPNGDMYFSEPYSIQQNSTKNNYAFRDYFQGALKTNDTYLGNEITSTEAPSILDAVIAVPVYSLKDNFTLVGVWAGGIDFNVLNKELQSLNITAIGDNTRVVYVGHLGQKVADSDVTKSKTPESFANLTSFKNAINGQSGSVIDTVNNSKMMITYQPVKIFHNTWAVLLMQPSLQQ